SHLILMTQELSKQALRMARSRLLSREPEAPHQAAHGVDVIAGAVALLDQLANVLQGESREPVLLDVGACEHRVCDLALLLRGEAARPARAWPVVESGHTLRVEALDRIAQRLVGHAR